MVKIIKKGNLPANEIARGECDNCESSLETTMSELSYRHSTRPTSHGEATCPLCEEDVWFYATGEFE